MEMYYVREYTPTCRFLKNNQLDPVFIKQIEIRRFIIKVSVISTNSLIL